MKTMIHIYSCLILIGIYILVGVAYNDHRPKAVVQKEPVAELAGAKEIMEAKAKEVDNLKKELKLVKKQRNKFHYRADSLAMEHIRKDGLLGDSSSFIVIDCTKF